MLYHAYQAQADLLWPLRAGARQTERWLDTPSRHASRPRSWQRRLAADCALLAITEVTHRRPAWGIAHVPGRPDLPIHEEAVATTPFATLLRFVRPGADALPKVLVVAPMSGHFATLLRDTVRTLLQDHDVHVTDWHNVRDVPLSAGRFGLDEYTQHLIDFVAAMHGASGEKAHVVAVCQPCVAALGAAAIMAEDDHPAAPASLTLMAGPIDCRVSPTTVNALATSKPIGWFERNLISVVPVQHRGGGRRVYPGVVQLTAFMSMNKERHQGAFRDYWHAVHDGDDEKAAVARAFYDEYMAVSDLSADFYLETVRRVFQEYVLPRGELAVAGRKVDPKAIRRTALVTIEGEKDDICAIGQTVAAQDLCSSLRPYLRTHYVQPGVGHYGVFSGKRWQNQIYPVVRGVIQTSR